MKSIFTNTSQREKPVCLASVWKQQVKLARTPYVMNLDVKHLQHISAMTSPTGTLVIMDFATCTMIGIPFAASCGQDSASQLQTV